MKETLKVLICLLLACGFMGTMYFLEQNPPIANFVVVFILIALPILFLTAVIYHVLFTEGK